MPTKRFDNLDPDRKKKLLDAAIAEFSRNGYERASLNDIIREAGISKGSLYYYFEDKLDLYVSIVKNMTEEVILSIGGLFDREGSGDFWADIEKMYEAGLSYMIAHPDIVAIGRDARSLMMKASLSPGAFGDLYEKGYGMFVDIFRRGQEMGAVRADVPLELLVSAIFYMGEGMDMWFLQHWDELDEAGRKRIMKLYADFARDIAGTKT